MIDNETGDLPSSEPVATDLDTIISQAYDTSVPDEAPVEGETAAETAERIRDERGRFAPKTPASETSEEGAIDDATQPEITTEAEPATVQPIEPPARWSEADKQKFAALPREAQEILLERVKATDADYTRKTQEIAEVRKQAEPLLAAVQPHEEYLNAIAPQIGVHPAQLVGQVIGFERVLRLGTPEQKAEVLQDIAGSYGIDLRAIATGEAQPAPDPVINQLRQTVATLQQELGQIKSTTEAEHSRQVSSQIESFASAQDANGQPKYPHFNVVRAAMGQLLANGEASTMEDAYALAAKPIEDRIAAALSAKAQEAEKQRQVALDKAKRAAPVRSMGSQPNGAVTAGADLDAILSQSIAKAGLG
jgi:hypothetical protein